MSVRKFDFKQIVVVAIIAIAATAHAHTGEVHQDNAANAKISSEQIRVFDLINKDYVQKVKPILERSCFNCHSSTTVYPWYANVPGAKQLIQDDINEAKTHLDLSRDFPFGGHGTPNSDLEAIRDSIKNGSMPPFRYRLMHPSSKLSRDERQAISEWVEQSLTSLSKSTPTQHD